MFIKRSMTIFILLIFSISLISCSNTALSPNSTSTTVAPTPTPRETFTITPPPTPTIAPTPIPTLVPTTVPTAIPTFPPEKLNWFVENKDILIKQAKKALSSHYDKVTKSTTYYIKGRKGDTHYYANKSMCIDPFVTFSNDGVVTFSTSIGFFASDWVFTDDIIFSIDGQNEEWYMDVSTRQDVIGFGNIVEGYSFADLSAFKGVLSLESDDYNYRIVNILTKIVNSKETIIRFSGSAGKHDVTISKVENNGVKQALILYASSNNRPDILDMLGLIPK